MLIIIIIMKGFLISTMNLNQRLFGGKSVIRRSSMWQPFTRFVYAIYQNELLSPVSCFNSRNDLFLVKFLRIFSWLSFSVKFCKEAAHTGWLDAATINFVIPFVIVNCRNDVRSHSVASLSPEELRDLETRARTTKPWNAWRRISLANKNEKNELFRELKNDPSERKKSFENWLVEKEVTRDIFTARMLEEERLKKLEKEKLEEERRLRYRFSCSSFSYLRYFMNSEARPKQ